jgi:hypothetical protein
VSENQGSAAGRDGRSGETRAIRREARTWEVLQVIMGLVITVSTAINAWLLTTVINHGERLATIEANRYTSEDALGMANAQAEQLLSIWTAISELRGELDGKAAIDRVPPAEITRWLERLETRMDRIEADERRRGQP